MKSKKYNQGELAELKVLVEKEILEVFQKMSQNTGISLADLVVIALKRFRHHHTDYERPRAASDNE